jgi:hypothetical protein
MMHGDCEIPIYDCTFVPTIDTSPWEMSKTDERTTWTSHLQQEHRQISNQSHAQIYLNASSKHSPPACTSYTFSHHHIISQPASGKQYKSGWKPLRTKKTRRLLSIKHVTHSHPALEVQRTQPVADRIRISKVLLHHTAERLGLEGGVLLRSPSGRSVLADTTARDNFEESVSQVLHESSRDDTHRREHRQTSSGFVVWSGFCESK